MNGMLVAILRAGAKICYIPFLAQKSAYSLIMQTLKLYLEHGQNGDHQLECYDMNHW